MDAEKLLAKMTQAGLLREVKSDHGAYTQHRLITLNAKFDPAKFSGEELQTLERVAARWADATAAQIEAATHDRPLGRPPRTERPSTMKWQNIDTPWALNLWTRHSQPRANLRTMLHRWRNRGE